MNPLRVLYHLGKADFLERVRRYSFLLTLGISVYFGYLAATGQLMLRMGNLRGIYNSAWIGALMSLVATCFLSLAGFYIVKNTVQRDRDSRVGRILAATPMTKAQYVLGKTISNFAVLAAMVVVLAISGIGMQFWRGEDPHVELWKLLAPFLFLALPMMTLVAAVAVLFEAISWLSGGFGNVLYFFVWSAGLTLPLATDLRVLDPSGIYVLANSMLTAANLSWKTGSFSLSLDFGAFGFVVSRFRWEGVHWTGEIILLRLLWVAVALLLAGISALLFDRFDSAGKALPEKSSVVTEDGQEHTAAYPRDYRPLSPLPSHTPKLRFAAMVAAELRLMLKGRSWWWYLVAAGLLIACLASPLEASRGGVLIAAWIWPILLWSQMGAREARNNTESLIFASAHALTRQLSAAWCAGALLAALTGGGVALRLLIAADWRGLAAWLTGVLFIPSLALAFGVWSGTPKLFEAVYTVWWYVGPAHHTAGIDFAGTTAASSSPVRYLFLAAVLLASACLGRRSRLAYA